CDAVRLQGRGEARYRAREDRSERNVRIAGHRREGADVARIDSLARERAAGAPREDELPFRPRGVELLSGHLRAVAELRVTRPEVDAGRERLVRVVLGDAPDAPAPRPDRAQADLLRDLLRGQGLQLGHLEPLPQRRAVAASEAGRRVEAEHDSDLAHRDARVRERGDPPPKDVAYVPAAGERPHSPDPR